jgi:hypothetical protein
MNKTVRLDDGKYEFEINNYGQIVSAKRHGSDWPAGYENRHFNAFVYALQRILVLEEKKDAVDRLVTATDSLIADVDSNGKIGLLAYDEAKVALAPFQTAEVLIPLPTKNS